MDPESTGGAQKRTHALMDLNLEVVARGIFAVDRENACLQDLDAVCVDFEEVLLQG